MYWRLTPYHPQTLMPYKIFQQIPHLQAHALKQGKAIKLKLF